MDNVTEKLHGLWPALFTPLDREGIINEFELEKLVEFLLKEQVDGLYILGSTGQGFLLSDAERKHFTEILLKMVHGRVPVIVQVGAMSTEKCVELARHAQKAGADAVSAVGPIYYGPSKSLAYEHYARIAHAVDIPFIPYQIGHAAHSTLIEKLMEIPNIAGMKLTTQNLLEISTVYRITKGRWKLFSGADELICQAALCGTAGAIGSTYNLLPSVFKKIREDFLKGEVAKASEFMLNFQALIDDILPVIWSFYRRAMWLKHEIEIGDPRQPLLAHPLPWTDEQIMKKMQDLENIANTPRMNLVTSKATI